RPATRTTVTQEGWTLFRPLVNHRITQARSLPPPSPDSASFTPIPSHRARSLSVSSSSDGTIPNLTGELRDLSDSSSSDSSLDYLPNNIQFHSSKMAGTASVTRHPAHKIAPVFGEGLITAAALLEWENACDDFFDAAKDPIPADKKVSKVTGGLHHTRINTYVRNNKARLNGLTFDTFMAELREVFLPTDWDQEVLQKILNSRMATDASFFDWSTSIISANNLLVGRSVMLSEIRIHEQLFHNMSEDLREKLKESPAELTAINALSLQKWLNAISETDLRMVKATKRNAKRLAAELEKEDKKRRTLAAPSRSANTQTNLHSAMAADRRPAGRIQPLSPEERALLFEHRGCYKCRVPYAGHQQWECPDGFPTVHVIITPELCRLAKLAYDANRRNSRPGGVAPRVSTRPPTVPAPTTPIRVAAITAEVPLDKSEDELDDEDEESSQIVAMTWPSAVAFGDSGSEGSDEVSQPLSVPHLQWDANALGPDGFPVPITGMFDTGAHVVLISPETVASLALEMKKLRKPLRIDLAINEKDTKEKKKNIVTLTHVVSFTLSTRNNSWTSKTVRAIVTPGLCTSILLGLPFLTHNAVIIDCLNRTAFVKNTTIDLLNPFTVPKPLAARSGKSPR
ncbi:hypothetical protein GALMADRAFT_46851, partial [Galerina marginata CBS 339.88]